MAEWKTYKLGEITSLVIDYRGKTPLKLGSNWSTSGYRALSAKNIKTGHIVNEESIHYADETLYKKWMKDEVQKEDILITSEAPFGQIFYWNSDEKIVLSQRLFCLRLNKEVVYPQFIYYYMQSNSFQGELDSRATGSTVMGLRQTELLKCLVNIPSLEEQKQIADILSSLDDKIEVNRKINENLEQQAEALFKSWFVDFEPFKDGKFIDSELGKIPEGWSVGKVRDLVNILSGFAFKSSTFVDNGNFKLVTIKNVQDGILDTDSVNYIATLPPKMPSYCLLKEQDILLSLTGNVGRVCIVNQGNLLLNQRVAKLQPQDEENRMFVYALFRQETFKTTLIQMSRGTAQLNLSPIETAEIKIVVPPKNVLNRYGEITNQMFDSIVNCQKNNLILSGVRDGLLPKLMSGEIKL